MHIILFEFHLANIFRVFSQSDSKIQLKKCRNSAVIRERVIFPNDHSEQHFNFIEIRTELQCLKTFNLTCQQLGRIVLMIFDWFLNQFPRFRKNEVRLMLMTQQVAGELFSIKISKVIRTYSIHKYT